MAAASAVGKIGKKGWMLVLDASRCTRHIQSIGATRPWAKQPVYQTTMYRIIERVSHRCRTDLGSGTTEEQTASSIFLQCSQLAVHTFKFAF